MPNREPSSSRSGPEIEPRSVPDPSAVDADLVLLHTRHACLDLGWLVRARAVLDATYRLAGVPHSEVP